MSAARRVVLVTGASSGIGLACARDLAAAGFAVVAGSRGSAGLETIARAGGSGVVGVRLDVTDAASIAAAVAVAETMADGRGLAGLVNNAGLTAIGPLEAASLAAVRELFEVNVFGVLAVTQAALPALRRGRGRIVNIGSIAGRSALPFMGSYSASKHAVEALTDALRVEVHPWGIDVAIVNAGAIDTPILDKALASSTDGEAAAAPDLRRLYAVGSASMRRAIEASSRAALPVSRMTRAVIHALTATRPRTRYLVGPEARQRVLLKWLPDRLHDWAVRRVIGLA